MRPKISFGNKLTVKAPVVTLTATSAVGPTKKKATMQKQDAADIKEHSAKKSPFPIKQKKGLSLAQLLKLTPPYVIAKAQDTDTQIITYKKGTKRGFTAISATCASLENKVRRKHKALVVGRDESLPGRKINRCTAIKVQCSCESYVMGYGFEYANWAHGAADIIYGNGQPPSTVNPSTRPGLCKHLWVLLREIKRAGD